MTQASLFDTPPRASHRGAWRRFGVVLLFGTFAGLCVLVEAPLCPSATLLGIPCPGCGLTRATLALLHADFYAALRLHPLSPLLAPLFFGAIFTAALGYVIPPARRPAPLPIANRFVTRASWLLLVLVLGVWLSRFFGAFGGPVPVRSIRAAPFRKFVAPKAGDAAPLSSRR